MQSNFIINEVVENVRKGFFTTDREWRITNVTRYTIDFFNMESDVLIGKILWSVLPDYIGTAFEAACYKAVKTNTVRRIEMRNVVTGNLYNFVIQPVAEGISVFWHDNALGSLHNDVVCENDEMYSRLLNEIDQGFFLIDVIFDENDVPVDMYYVEANNTSKKMLGMDFTGRYLKEIDPSYEPYWYEIFGGVAVTGKSVRLERYAEPDKKWYSFNVFKIGGSNSRRVGNIFLDITDKKKSEEALKESEELYRTLFDKTDDGFQIIKLIYDENGRLYDFRYLKVNDAHERLTGYKASDLIEKTIRQVDINIESEWFAVYDKVNKYEKALHSIIFNEFTNRWYDLFCFPYSKDIIGVLFSDTTAKKLSEIALEESEKKAQKLIVELRKADKHKNEFISVLSHELRNPLASIMMGVSLMEHSTPDSRQTMRARETIKRQATHLSRLVDDLLDVSRIANDKLEIKKERIEINELTRSIIADYKSKFDEKGIALEEEYTTGLLYIFADHHRMLEVMGNLLINAFKFTERGGKTTVILTTDKDANKAVIKVRDTGIGISPQLVPDLFNPFVQADESLDRTNGGLGLGLAIVKGIIELHGGTVEVYSEGMGMGTEFTIRLPLLTEKHMTEEKG